MTNQEHRRKKMSGSRRKRNKNIAIRNYSTQGILNCVYCTKELVTSNFTLDHFIPTSKFKKQKPSESPHRTSNLVVCCVECNDAKADLLPQEFLSILRKENLIPKKDIKIYSINKTLLLEI